MNVCLHPQKGMKCSVIQIIPHAIVHFVLLFFNWFKHVLGCKIKTSTGSIQNWTCETFYRNTSYLQSSRFLPELCGGRARLRSTCQTAHSICLSPCGILALQSTVIKKIISKNFAITKSNSSMCSCTQFHCNIQLQTWEQNEATKRPLNRTMVFFVLFLLFISMLKYVSLLYVSCSVLSKSKITRNSSASTGSCGPAPLCLRESSAYRLATSFCDSSLIDFVSFSPSAQPSSDA